MPSMLARHHVLAGSKKERLKKQQARHARLASQYPGHYKNWGRIINGEKFFPVHAAQAEVLQSKARFTAAIAGTGGGKTAVGPLWLMQQIARKRKGLWLVVAPTHQVMARATAASLVETFKGTTYEGTYVESRNQYRLPDGGIIWLLSADRPDTLEGGQFDGAWIDEAGQLKLKAWIAIQGRLGQREAPALLTTTPYSMNWLYHGFFRYFLAGDKDYNCVQWSSYQNPVYTKKEYDRAKKVMNKSRGEMRYDGIFGKPAGLVYPDFDSCVVSAFHPPEGELVGGIDFGWSHPFAALVGTHYIDPEGRDMLYIWYERYIRSMTVKQHARHLPKKALYFCPPERPDSIRDLQDNGIDATKADNKVLDGIDKVNTRIVERRLLVSDECVALIAEAGQYAYKEAGDDETFSDTVTKLFDDALDALRYLVASMDHAA